MTHLAELGTEKVSHPRPNGITSDEILAAAIVEYSSVGIEVPVRAAQVERVDLVVILFDESEERILAGFRAEGSAKDKRSWTSLESRTFEGPVGLLHISVVAGKIGIRVVGVTLHLLATRTVESVPIVRCQGNFVLNTFYEVRLESKGKRNYLSALDVREI